MDKWGVVSQTFPEGQFSIDVDRLWKLYYDRQRTENYLTDRYCKKVKADSVLLPKVVTLEVQWTKAAESARQAADIRTATTCYKLSAGEYSAHSFRQHLKAEIGSLDAARTRWTEQIQSNGRRNAEAIASNVGGWDWAIAGAKGIRTGSATVLAIGAVVLTGGGAAGAGLAATGAGSMLTGVGKAQDSEKHLTTEQAIGTAVVSGAFDFTTSVLTGGIAKGAKLAWAGKTVLAFLVKVPTKTVTSVMVAEMTRSKSDDKTDLGAHAWKAVQEVAVEQAVGLSTTQLLKIPQVNAVVRKLAIAAASTVRQSADPLVGAFGAKAARKLAEKTTKGALKSGATKMFDSAAAAVTGASQSKNPLPEAVVRQPVHGGPAVAQALISAIVRRVN